jgi:hypothetical protein
MNSSRVLKIALLIAIVILVSNAVAISRDYQDSWILEGLEIPFLLCVVTYVLAFFSEERVPLMVALAVVARCVFLAIPNLKYVWFQGTAIDQQTQYALADYVYKQGFIATQGPFGVLVYGSTPLIQLSLAMFSIVLNVQVVDSMKYLPVLLSPIYPLGTYVIVKNLKFSNSQSIMKYALFISSIPISIENYIVTGSQFGVLLAFFALTGLSMLVRRNDRRYLLVFVLSVFGLAVAHSPSSFLLTIFLLTALAIQRIPLSQMMSSLRVPVILAVTSICTTWLMFPARYTFETIVRLGFLRVQGEGAESVPPRFLELARVNMLGAFNTLLATDGAEIFLLLLASTGLIILLRTWKHLEKTSRSFLVVGATVFLFIPLGGLLSIGVFRIVFFASTLFPIFASILFVEYEGKRAMRLRKVVLPSIVLLILLSAALGLYGCQPLIPSASILLKDLPVDQPLGYVTSVNSIYQRQMIEFAQNNVAGQIACDSVTGDQITGLTDLNFSANHLTYYYPLDKKQPAKDYSYFLIHVPGIAGPFSNSAETRTRDMILTVINNSSNIYTNGESYILLNQTIVAQP